MALFLRPVIRFLSHPVSMKSATSCSSRSRCCNIAIASGCSSFSSAAGNFPRLVLNGQGSNLETGPAFKLFKRSYGGKPPYSLKTVQDRVMLVLQLFDKIKPEKLTLDSHFINDLGLDSLDHVEIMLQLEHEFTMEIPDGDAEELMTPRKIVQYICDAEDVFE